MIDKEQDTRERDVAHGTLTRLANSCDCAAARGNTVMPFAADLNHEDYATIADILRKMAGTLESHSN